VSDPHDTPATRQPQQFERKGERCSAVNQREKKTNQLRGGNEIGKKKKPGKKPRGEWKLNWRRRGGLLLLRGRGSVLRNTRGEGQFWRRLP